MNEFLKDVLSQGTALTQLLANITENFEGLFTPIRDMLDKRHISRIILTGMGSSYFSGYVPYYMLKQQGFSVDLIDAGEFFLHGIPSELGGALGNICIIAISQSGESGEIVELLTHFSQMKVKPVIIGITNAPQSFLATHSDFQLFLHAGEEKSVTTKTYVNSILLLYILVQSISPAPFSLTQELEIIRPWIHRISDLFPSNIAVNSDDSLENLIPDLNELFGNEYGFIQILTRGPSLATAHQAALNFKELTKIHSEAASLSTFRHGGIESLTENSKLIILSSSPKSYAIDNQFIRNLIERWQFGQLLYITTQELAKIDEQIRKNPKILIYTMDLQDEFLAPLLEIVILQIMIYQTTVKRGIVPGTFRFTQKITRGL